MAKKIKKIKKNSLENNNVNNLLIGAKVGAYSHIATKDIKNTATIFKIIRYIKDASPPIYIKL